MQKILRLSNLGATNAQGHYEFANIQPGKYFITVSHIGLATANSPAFETMNPEFTSVPRNYSCKKFCWFKRSGCYFTQTNCGSKSR